MIKKEFDYSEFIRQLTVAAQQMPEILPEILSTILAKPVTDNTKKEIEKSASSLLEMVTKVAPSFTSIKNIKEQEARNKAILDLAESGFKSYLKDIPPGKNVIDFLIDFFGSKETLQPGNYLLGTSYEKYTAAVAELSKDFVASVPMDKRSEFLDSVFSSGQDVLSMGQSVITEFPKMHKDLSMQRQRFTKKQATKDIEYYDKLAGHYEKCISTVAGVIRLTNGENVTYEIMRRRKLASNLRTVNDSKYSLLTAGFNKNIRNALAHKQFMVNPQKRNVTFYDPIARFSVDYSYKEINEKTKELCALFISIQRLPMQIWSDTFIKFKVS